MRQEQIETDSSLYAGRHHSLQWLSGKATIDARIRCVQNERLWEIRAGGNVPLQLQIVYVMVSDIFDIPGNCYNFEKSLWQ